MDGSTLGAAFALMKKNKPTDAQVESAVSDWLDDHPEATTTVQDGSITKAKLDENLQGTVDDVSDLKSAIALQEETIPDTTQTITFDQSGNVASIVHTDGNENVVRSDVFTFGANTITEVRTLASGESLTIVTNTDTLVTTVTYAAA